LSVLQQETGKGRELRHYEACKKWHCRKRSHQGEHKAEHQHGNRQFSEFTDVGSLDQGTRPGIPAWYYEPQRQKGVRNHAGQAAKQR